MSLSDEKDKLIELLQEKNSLLEENRALDKKKIELQAQMIDLLKKNLASSERAVEVQNETIMNMTKILRLHGIKILSDVN